MLFLGISLWWNTRGGVGSSGGGGASNFNALFAGTF